MDIVYINVGKKGGVYVRHIRIPAIALCLILIISTVFSFASESVTYEINQDSITDTSSARYAIPMSMRVGIGFESYKAVAIVDISTDTSNADYFMLRVVLERYNGSGYTVEKTWRDQKVSVDDCGFAYFEKYHTVSKGGSYRIRVSGEGYKGSDCVVTFSNKVSQVASC